MRSYIIVFIIPIFVTLGLPISIHAQTEPPVIERGYAVSGTDGAVSSGGSTATNVGLDILLSGGNAFDASAATILALTETDPGNVHFGGEVPIIFYDAQTNQTVKVMSGLGPAPAAATLEYFQSIGGIPSVNSGVKNAAVPGLPLVIITMVKDYGTMTFEQVASPAQALFAAESGWKADMAVTLGRMIQADIGVRNAGGTREAGLDAARDIFYAGTIGAEMAAWIQANGGLMTLQDLASYATNPDAQYEDPVWIDYKGYTVYKCNTWTQGPYLLETLQILEGIVSPIASLGHNSADYIHTVIEALKLGLADRDQYYGDPNFVSVPLDALLSDAYADVRRDLIDPNNASLSIQPGDPYSVQALTAVNAPDIGLPGAVYDTSTSIVADRWGNVVVATPSGWGGTIIGDTGVRMNSRLVSFNTEPTGHPNNIAPGKRPRITLTPTLVFKDGKPVIGISVAGGDKQDQAALQVLLNLIEFGMSPEDSVKTSAYPRFGTNHLTGSFSQPAPQLGSLIVDPDVPSTVRNNLAGRGHNISTSNSAYGKTSVIVLQQDTGVLSAAGDQSAGRYAAAYSLPTPPDTPVANDDSVTTSEDTPIQIEVLANDVDPNDDALTIINVTQPADGTVTTDGATVTYTPNLNYASPDSMTYTDDPFNTSAPAYASGAISGASGYSGAGASVYLGGIDDNEISGMSGGWRGAFDAQDSQPSTLTFRYNLTIDSDYENDEYGQVRVTLDGNPVGAPVAQLTGDGNGGSDQSAGWQLANVDLGSLLGTHELVIGAYNNKKTLNNEWTLLLIDDVSITGNSSTASLFAVDFDGEGVDSFTYTIEDDNQNSDTATVRVTVMPINDAPVAVDDETVTDENTPVIIDVLANDTDIEGDGLTITNIDDEVNGIAVINAENMIVFTPRQDYDGTASFTYRASDSDSDSNAATVTIIVESAPALAVSVGYVHAERNGDTVRFVWQTASESGMAGFNVLAVADATVTQLNTELIASAEIDSVTPTGYRFSVVTDAMSYYLEEVSIEGKISRSGPFAVGAEYGALSATDALAPVIYLPVMQR